MLVRCRLWPGLRQAEGAGLFRPPLDSVPGGAMSSPSPVWSACNHPPLLLLPPSVLAQHTHCCSRKKMAYTLLPASSPLVGTGFSEVITMSWPWVLESDHCLLVDRPPSPQTMTRDFPPAPRGPYTLGCLLLGTEVLKGMVGLCCRLHPGSHQGHYHRV